QRQHQPFGLCPKNVGRHTAQIDVVKKPRDQPDSQRQDDNRANAGSHRGLERSYYTAPTCSCCPSRVHPCKTPCFAGRGSWCRSPRPFSRPHWPTADRIDGEKSATSTTSAIAC